MFQKNIRIWLPLLLGIMLALGIFLGKIFSFSPGGNNSLGSSKLESIIKLIDNDYVDTVSKEKLNEDAIVSLLKELDPHSVYIPAKDLQEVNEPLEGGFSGIGVQFNMQTDTVYVINTIPNGPSAKVGILAGDKIITINDSVVAGRKISNDKIVKQLKGPEGTKVRVGIKRHNVAKLIDFEITRGQIPLYSVDISYMITPNVGYIKINQFSRTTADEFIAGVKKLQSQGMKKLIVDLRGNGGGLLDIVNTIADQFLDDNKLIVYTQGRARPRRDARATSKGICQKEDVAILIDEFSASASEILAGAIQDNDRGIIIGRRSFGKGLVQEQIELADGSALRLTVARYYTPTGRCIQKPYTKGDEEDYEMDILNRYHKGEFLSRDSIHFADSLKFTTPGGKVVYGGGGIMPDVFVPLDTIGSSLRSTGLIYKFSFEYTDNHRDAMKSCKTPAALVAWLDHNNVSGEFLKYLAKNKYKISESSWKRSKPEIENEVKAYIARNILDNAGFYPILNKSDATIQKAVELLSAKK
jgi:carboxyl-terminal processing protease